MSRLGADERTRSAARHMNGNRVESLLRDGRNGRAQRGDVVARDVVGQAGGDGLIWTINDGVFGGWWWSLPCLTLTCRLPKEKLLLTVGVPPFTSHRAAIANDLAKGCRILNCLLSENQSGESRHT